MSDGPPPLLSRLRERGWRLTAQRRAVVGALRGADVHLTAEEVHRAAVSVLPDVSRATIYNTLNELVSMGDVGEVVLGGRTRFDPNVTTPHHHLVCDRCGLIRDVPVADLGLGSGFGEAVTVDGAVFLPSRAELVIHGECADRRACDRRRESQTPSA